MDIKHYKLQCGIAYKFKKCDEKDGQTFFSLVIRCGAKNDGYREGIAHFLEHMLLEFEVESMNDIYIKGTTMINKTIYVMVCPNDKIQCILYYIKQIVFGYSLKKRNIGKVRQDVFNEYSKKISSKRYNIYDEFIGKIEIATHLPIGKVEIINKITFEEIYDFYKKYYVSDRICLSIISNLDITPTYIDKKFQSPNQKNNFTNNKNTVITAKKNIVSLEDLQKRTYMVFFQDIVITQAGLYAYYDLLESISLTYIEWIICSELKMRDEDVIVDVIHYDERKKYIRILLLDREFEIENSKINKVFLCLKNKIDERQIFIDEIIEKYKQLLNEDCFEKYDYIKYMAECYIYNTTEYENSDLLNYLKKITREEVVSYLLKKFDYNKKSIYKF